MTRQDLEMKTWQMNKHYLNPFRVAKGIFSFHTYRRRMYLWWLLVSLRVMLDYLLDRIIPSRFRTRKDTLSDYTGMIRPEWYDS